MQSGETKSLRSGNLTLYEKPQDSYFTLFAAFVVLNNLLLLVFLYILNELPRLAFHNFTQFPERFGGDRAIMSDSVQGRRFNSLIS